MSASNFVVSRTRSTENVSTSTGDVGGSGCSIDDLSDETLLKVFGYCDPYAITRFTIVNRRWNGLGNSLLETDWTEFSDDADALRGLTNDELNQLIHRIAPIRNLLKRAIFTLQSPREAEFGSESFSDQEIVIQIISACQSTLRALLLQYIEDLTEDFARRLAPYLRNLRELYLNYEIHGSNNSIDASVLLVQAPKELHDLALPLGFDAEDRRPTREVLCWHSETLRSLDLSGCRFDFDDLLESLGIPISTKKRKLSPLKLEELNLPKHIWMYNATKMRRLGSRLTNLTYLDLTHLAYGGRGSPSLSNIFRSTPKLRTIIADSTSAITDEVLLCLPSACRGLRKLHLRGNTEVTESALCQFIRSAPDSLDDLGLAIVGCVTDSVVLELLNRSRKQSWQAFKSNPKNFVSRCNFVFSVVYCEDVTYASFVFFVLRMFEYYLVRPGEICPQPLSSLRWTREISGFLSTDVQDADQLTSVVESCYPFMMSSFYECFLHSDPEYNKATRRSLLGEMRKALIGDAGSRPRRPRLPPKEKMQSLFKKYLEDLVTFKEARFAICSLRTAMETAFGREEVEEVLNGLGIKLLAYEENQEDYDLEAETGDLLEV
ncbi:hypothetical protein BZA70DRAFT_309342 [Myxozyma melibiosi]|uniref:F-box domain-containing protein n=1 Tax=Myxozyma melibiosi TaxID=54550 RepID=A0ABR1F9M5_9ASCO